MFEVLTINDLTAEERAVYDSILDMFDGILNKPARAGDDSLSADYVPKTTQGRCRVYSHETHQFSQDGSLNYFRLFLTPPDAEEQDR